MQTRVSKEPMQAHRMSYDMNGAMVPMIVSSIVFALIGGLEAAIAVGGIWICFYIGTLVVYPLIKLLERFDS